MILSYYNKSKNNDTENNILLQNKYDMLKSSIKDKYKNSKRKFDSQSRKYRFHSKAIKKLEYDISHSLEKFQENRGKDFNKINKSVNSFSSEHNETLISECTNDSSCILKEKRKNEEQLDSIFINNNCKDNERNYKNFYKLNFQKLNQIIEINTQIFYNYEKDIKSLIKNRLLFKLDNNTINNFHNDDINSRAEKNIIANSEKLIKTSKKKEDCIIF